MSVLTIQNWTIHISNTGVLHPCAVHSSVPHIDTSSTGTSHACASTSGVVTHYISKGWPIKWPTNKAGNVSPQASRDFNAPMVDLRNTCLLQEQSKLQAPECAYSGFQVKSANKCTDTGHADLVTYSTKYCFDLPRVTTPQLGPIEISPGFRVIVLSIVGD